MQAQTKNRSPTYQKISPTKKQQSFFKRQGYDMSRSDLYIVRRHKDGSLALSRPCPGCMSLLRANGVRRVFFSVEGGFSEERI